MDNSEISKAIEIGKRYTKRSELRKKEFHYYSILKTNQLLDDVIPLKHPTLTYEMCYNIAKQYECYTDFRTMANKYYCKSLSKGWIKDYVWLKRGFYDMNAKIHIVYVYEIKGWNYAYVGRTMRPKIRIKQHYSDENDSLYKFIRNNNISTNEIEYKVIINNLTAQESQTYEKYYVNEYEKNGWKLINKAKAGSLGGNVQFWDYEKCYEEALKYQSETDFRKLSLSAYQKSIKMGWRNDYYWLEKYDPHTYYSYEECYCAAKQCESYNDFSRRFSSIYRYSKLNDLLKDFKWLIIKARHDNIIEYDLQGNFIAEHTNDSFKGAKRQSVLNCANGKLNYGYDRIWKYKSNVVDIEGNILRRIDGIKECGVNVIQYSSNGDYIREFNTMNEAAKSVGCSNSSIFDAVKSEKTILCYGYAWRYKKDVLDENGEVLEHISLRKDKVKKHIVEYDKNGNFVKTYDTITHAYKAHTRHKVEWTLKDLWKKSKTNPNKMYYGVLFYYENDVLDKEGKIKRKINMN